MKTHDQANKVKSTVQFRASVVALLGLCFFAFWLLPSVNLRIKKLQISQQTAHGVLDCKAAPSYWPSTLVSRNSKVFSQNGEDGIISAIFSFIQTTNKYYVEFGTESGMECNTRLLREQRGWEGLLMDGGNENHTIGLYKEFITPENIKDLFMKYRVPREFDLLSIDVNFDDWHVWRSISSQYRPRVVILEYNSAIAAEESRVVDPKDPERWPGNKGTTNFFGASLKALYYLGRSIGYTLIACDEVGVNAFFVLTEILECQKAKALPFHEIYVHNPWPNNLPESNPDRYWLQVDEHAQVVGRVSAASLLTPDDKHILSMAGISTHSDYT